MSFTLDIKEITLETNTVVFNCSLWEVYGGGNLHHWHLIWGFEKQTLPNVSNHLPFTWSIIKFRVLQIILRRHL